MSISSDFLFITSSHDNTFAQHISWCHRYVMTGKEHLINIQSLSNILAAAAKNFVQICCHSTEQWKKNSAAWCIALYGRPITELRSVTCHMESHSVTCNPTQVNAHRLDHSHAGRYSIYPPLRDGRLSWPWCWLYTEMVYLLVDSHQSK